MIIITVILIIIILVIIIIITDKVSSICNMHRATDKHLERSLFLTYSQLNHIYNLNYLCGNMYGNMVCLFTVIQMLFRSNNAVNMNSESSKTMC